MEQVEYFTTITCNVGLVVEYDPATVETRVRFPDVASFELLFVCCLGVHASPLRFAEFFGRGVNPLTRELIRFQCTVTLHPRTSDRSDRVLSF